MQYTCRRSRADGVKDWALKIACWISVLAALLMMAEPAFAVTLTTVTGTLYNPAGQTMNGTISIYNNVAFTANDGTLVPRGAVSDTTVANGLFSVPLVPTQGSTPSGASYQATYKLGLTTFVETWNVPISASPVNVSAVRTLPIISTGLVFQGTVTAGDCVQVVNYSTVEDAGTGCGGSALSIQTNGLGNSSQALLNFITSTTNGVGLTVTPSNPAGGNEKFEITGSSYTGNAATATALAAIPSQCTGSQFATGVAVNGNANCATPAGGAPGGSANSIQYNNAGAFGGFGSWNGSTLTIPNGANAGITFGAANGRVTGSGGGYLNFDGSGSPSLNASGTNQNITLTPSGTGATVLGAGALSFSAAGSINATGTNNSINIRGGGGASAVAAMGPSSSAGTSQINIGAGNSYLDSNLWTVRASSGGTGTQFLINGSFGSTVNSYTCSGTCTVNLSLGNSIWITLSGAVTSVVLNNPKGGSKYTLNWIQDATGETVSGFPAAWHGITAPGSTASTYSTQSCEWNGSLAVCGAANTNIP